MCWQVTGVPKDYLVEINSHLLKEDVILYLKGKRHIVAKERKRIHEKDDKLIKKAGKVFDELAEEYNWTTINAVGTIEEVHKRIWKFFQEAESQKS